MNDRISLILKYKNISATKFADEIDVQRSSISHILSERNKPSLEFIQKILKTYPEISPEWLISGKGAMLKNPDLFEQLDTNTKKENILPLQTHSDSENKVSHKVALNNVLPVYNELNNVIKEVKKSTSNTVKQKKIEKILVFFTDSSFKEYLPENDN